MVLSSLTHFHRGEEGGDAQTEFQETCLPFSRIFEKSMDLQFCIHLLGFSMPEFPTYLVPFVSPRNI